MTALHSFPPSGGSDADKVVALVAELRETWSQYRLLSQQLRPGSAGGPAMQAAAPRLLRLSREADRQRPYLLGADARWEDYTGVDQHVATLLGRYDRTVARVAQARGEGREELAGALERSLPELGAEIVQAARERADTATAAFDAAKRVYHQAGPDGVVTRHQVDAAALDAVDADHLARQDALVRFQHAEQALFRAGWTVEGSHDRDGLLRLRSCHDQDSGGRFTAITAALGKTAQLADEQPTPKVLRLRPVSAPARHLNTVRHQDQGWELDR
ncbi:hypothetical protein [Nocardia sp. CS682]|uniref:hypothetical protein n=1 Tax=Nocardia sp. CS682 TaxID=1047172 RepID=UPI0010750A28|nr:hypothetical protein [Nocardia sp. CS682]QBS43568.1 hypothetical protein DMB37_29155 [Nocardia sp. CS682]